MPEDTCVLCEPAATTEVVDTSLCFDVIGPMVTDENKLRVEETTTGEAWSLVEAELDLCCSGVALRLVTTADGARVVVGVVAFLFP